MADSLNETSAAISEREDGIEKFDAIVIGSGVGSSKLDMDGASGQTLRRPQSITPPYKYTERHCRRSRTAAC